MAWFERDDDQPWHVGEPPPMTKADWVFLGFLLSVVAVGIVGWLF